MASQTQTKLNRLGTRQTVSATVGVALGVWLAVSALIWPHTVSQRINQVICGALVALFAAASRMTPSVRLLSMLMAVWLFIASVLLPSHSAWAILNNQVVAFLVFLTAIATPGTSRRTVQARRRVV